MNTKTLSNKVKFLDQQYKQGSALVFDKEFDQLENRLKEIDPIA